MSSLTEERRIIISENISKNHCDLQIRRSLIFRILSQKMGILRHIGAEFRLKNLRLLLGVLLKKLHYL